MSYKVTLMLFLWGSGYSSLYCMALPTIQDHLELINYQFDLQTWDNGIQMCFLDPIVVLAPR